MFEELKKFIVKFLSDAQVKACVAWHNQPALTLSSSAGEGWAFDINWQHEIVTVMFNQRTSPQKVAAVAQCLVSELRARLALLDRSKIERTAINRGLLFQHYELGNFPDPHGHIPFFRLPDSSETTQFIASLESCTEKDFSHVVTAYRHAATDYESIIKTCIDRITFELDAIRFHVEDFLKKIGNVFVMSYFSTMLENIFERYLPQIERRYCKILANFLSLVCTALFMEDPLPNILFFLAGFVFNQLSKIISFQFGRNLKNLLRYLSLFLGLAMLAFPKKIMMMFFAYLISLTPYIAGTAAATIVPSALGRLMAELTLALVHRVNHT